MSGSEIETLAKAVLGMCAIMRTQTDLTPEQQLDLGFIHGELIALRQAQGADIPNAREPDDL